MKPIITELNKKIAAIRKQWNATPGTGPRVDLGSCTQRLHRLDGPYYLCCKDYGNWADMIEEMACLDLKKFYLKRACDCEDQGGYSLDEVLQDQTLEAYAAVSKLQKRALHHGIRDPAIRAYVAEARKLLVCIQIGSINGLRKIETKIKEHLDASE
jgi:hypothetical protein